MTRGLLVRRCHATGYGMVFRAPLNARHYERILFELTHGLGYRLYEGTGERLSRCLKVFR